MTVFELAQKYYPRLWNKARIQALADAGRLTREEAAELCADSTSIAKED